MIASPAVDAGTGGMTARIEQANKIDPITAVQDTIGKCQTNRVASSFSCAMYYTETGRISGRRYVNRLKTWKDYMADCLYRAS
eukprot:scaffold24657_cov38-Attheya_sp.AAC.2